MPGALYDAYRATARFVSPDGETIQFEAGLTAGDAGSTAALNAVPAIRRTLTAVQHSIGATASGVAGQAPALYDVSSISDGDLIRIVPIAIIAIGILLALVLRSLVAPLYLIASVLLSYLAALGLASIVFIKIGHSGGLTFLLPFLMFIFLLALGEDYNILVMTRIREEAHHRRLRDAVVTAVGASGPTVTSAGLVLAGTFLVLAVTAGSEPGGSQIRDIGLGLALGILMDTFLVRSLLVPSTVSLLGRWNWWPGKLAEMDEARRGRFGDREAPAGLRPSRSQQESAWLTVSGGWVAGTTPLRALSSDDSSQMNGGSQRPEQYRVRARRGDQSQPWAVPRGGLVVLSGVHHVLERDTGERLQRVGSEVLLHPTSGGLVTTGGPGPSGANMNKRRLGEELRMFEKMLVALDDSDHTQTTLLKVTDLAKLAGGEVEVLHVRESHFIGRAGAVPDEDTDQSKTVVADAVKILNDAGVHATGKVRGALHGRVAREILDEAAESGASVIVMGSHGTTELEGVLLGSTTHKVLHLGKLPVFVVR